MSRLSILLICIYIACVTKHVSANPQMLQMLASQTKIDQFDSNIQSLQNAIISKNTALNIHTNLWHSASAQLDVAQADYATYTALWETSEEQLLTATNALDTANDQIASDSAYLTTLQNALHQIEDTYASCTSIDCGVFQRRGTCNDVTGNCECLFPWTGDNCDTKSGCETRRLLATQDWTNCDSDCSDSGDPKAYLLSRVNTEIAMYSASKSDLESTLPGLEQAMDLAMEARDAAFAAKETQYGLVQQYLDQQQDEQINIDNLTSIIDTKKLQLSRDLESKDMEVFYVVYLCNQECTNAGMFGSAAYNICTVTHGIDCGLL